MGAGGVFLIIYCFKSYNKPTTSIGETFASDFLKLFRIFFRKIVILLNKLLRIGKIAKFPKINFREWAILNFRGKVKLAKVSLA